MNKEPDIAATEQKETTDSVGPLFIHTRARSIRWSFVESIDFKDPSNSTHSVIQQKNPVTATIYSPCPETEYNGLQGNLLHYAKKHHWIVSLRGRVGDPVCIINPAEVVGAEYSKTSDAAVVTFRNGKNREYSCKPQVILEGVKRWEEMQNAKSSPGAGIGG